MATEAINPWREFFLGENYSELGHTILFEMEMFICISLTQMSLEERSFPDSYRWGFLSRVLLTETEYKTHGYEYINHSPNISQKC